MAVSIVLGTVAGAVELATHGHPIWAIAVLVGVPILVVVIAVVATVVTAWVAYAAGFKEGESLTRRQMFLAFLMLPVGVYAVPLVMLLRPEHWLSPLLPPPVANELKEKRARGA